MRRTLILIPNKQLPFGGESFVIWGKPNAPNVSLEVIDLETTPLPVLRLKGSSGIRMELHRLLFRRFRRPWP